MTTTRHSPAIRTRPGKAVLASILLGAASWLLPPPLPMCAADFSFQTGDVVAFVGGEDTVARNEHGYLELLLSAAASADQVRFRNLGWEGDTVFEQRRDLNFGSWPEQLRRAGATVAVCQFGKMEALRGTEHLGEFIASYDKLLDDLSARVGRIVLLSPTPFEPADAPLPDLAPRNGDVSAYADAIRALAERRGLGYVDLYQPLAEAAASGTPLTRDGNHLNAAGHWRAARATVEQLGLEVAVKGLGMDAETGMLAPARYEQARQAILRKNRLWFDYWRPMNWAFLAGDRTEQPSSRDHRDPSVRWFPKEMQEFLPLIQEKESEIRTRLRRP